MTRLAQGNEEFALFTSPLFGVRLTFPLFGGRRYARRLFGDAGLLLIQFDLNHVIRSFRLDCHAVARVHGKEMKRGGKKGVRAIYYNPQSHLAHQGAGLPCAISRIVGKCV